MEGNYTSTVYTPQQGTDAVWILLSTGFIFFMPAGFALIESGAVRRKNKSYMMMKNLFCACIAAVVFWLFGYGFAFGNPEFFVGNDAKFYASYGFEQVEEDNYLFWNIQFAYCMVVVAIFQGALAERTQIFAYLIFTTLLAGVIYPIILAWTWGKGWLADKGFHDFAGAGIVHLVGGICAFWGAANAGQRLSKIKKQSAEIDNKPLNLHPQIKKEIMQRDADYNYIAMRYFRPTGDDLIPNNNMYIVLGTFIVWTGYIFFTGGRTYTQFGPRTSASSKIIQNMFISSGFSGLASFALKYLVRKYEGRTMEQQECLTICNGILIGLVSIGAVADQTQNWGSVLIGVISAFWYIGAVLFLEFYRIDDPIEAFPVHGAGGIWGLFAAGFFDNYRGALFYGAFRQGAFMGYQVVGIFVIVAWTSLIAAPAFLIMKKLNILRVEKAIEEIGFDVVHLNAISDQYLQAVRSRIKAKEIREEFQNFKRIKEEEEAANADENNDDEKE